MYATCVAMQANGFSLFFSPTRAGEMFFAVDVAFRGDRLAAGWAMTGLTDRQSASPTK